MLKKEVRKIIFKKRKSYDNSFFNSLNDIFYNNFLSTNFLTSIQNTTIAGYYAFDNECNIFEILKYYSKNNHVVLPSIVEKNKSMIFKEWDCTIDKLEVNKLFKKTKILEPVHDCKELKPNIVFIPAVAVDIYGNRVGYGAGYYDKTLCNIDCIKIATVYNFQVFNEEIEHDKNDVAVDYILTESKFINIV